ncbi:hypothetical protein Mth01_16260 [Sphaerimonospora thailandensis]|uniref:Secreted protein n=1 Tax=Sphaerimonospora thailandensis TaxID=795644 RepID=A0A8J3RBA7_9ACTN|nr:hypothetical protein Mth01_16260 [Sphaerimonospora thailandensis]
MRHKLATVIAACSLTALGFAATPASAASLSDTAPISNEPGSSAPSDITPLGGNGRCYTNWTTSTQANVWCDGTGPERYGASIVCAKGSKTKQIDYSNGPWFGDRRGITMTCPSGWTRATQWGWPA